MATKKRGKSLLSAEAKAAIKAAKWQRKQAELLYKEKIKEMRPYLKALRNIDLRKPITRGQKSFITRAFKDYTELTTRPNQLYRTKNKKNLKLVQAASQQFTKTKFDVAFVPTVPGSKVKIKNGKVIISSKWVDETKILFDMKKLAIDPQAEIERVIKANPKITAFAVMAGAYLWNGAIDPELVMKKVLPLFSRYDIGGEGYKKRGENSHFTNWAFGFRGFTAKGNSFDDLSEHLRDYHSQEMDIKYRKRRERRARRRKELAAGLKKKG